MKSTQSSIFTQLSPIISQLKYTSSKPSHCFTNPIKVLLLQKKQIFYITDGHIIYQANMPLSSKNQCSQQLPKPFNRIRTNYYNFQTKHAKMFIFNQEDQQNNKLVSIYLSPYQPKFHFQDRLQNFNYRQARDQMGYNMQVLVLHKWGFKFVNIANTGYYGIVIQIYQYNRYKQKFIISNTIHSVLYQKQLAQKLQKLRIADMRQQIQQPNRQNSISLCYYRKNLKDSFINKSLLSNFVCADKNCKIIKYNTNLRQNYIPLGNIVGVMRFIRPMLNYTESKKTAINFHKFKEISIQVQEQDKVSSQFSEDEEQEEIDQKLSGQDQDQDQNEDSDEESSSNQQQEPLKLIYLKQLQKMNII